MTKLPDNVYFELLKLVISNATPDNVNVFCVTVRKVGGSLEVRHFGTGCPACLVEIIKDGSDKNLYQHIEKESLSNKVH